MRTVFLIVLGIVISTFSTMIALAWTAPTASPPGNNVSSPINTGATSQLKNGTLGVNDLGVFGNTILNGANGDNNGNGVNSYLNFGATAGQSGYGIRDNNGTLEFRNSNGSWGSLNVTLVNLLTVNGITPNGLGQITSIKFGDGSTQSTAAANPWSINGTKIYYTGGNVGIGLSSPQVTLDVAGAVRPGSQSAVTQCGLGQANGEGSQRYNYTTHTMEYCNGTRWTATTPIMLGHGTVNIVDPADSNVHCINTRLTPGAGLPQTAFKT